MKQEINDDTAAGDSPIRRIGRYEIGTELGRGGFGRVYRAYDPDMQRLVAVKVLNADAGPEQITRFRNEAAAAGNLRHKNIVTVHDFGEHLGQPYLVMEFLAGEDLEQVIARGKLPSLLEAVGIMQQAADALDCAHRAGVVHGDVKPGNTRLLPDGTVKLMDFGSSRLAGEGPGMRTGSTNRFVGTILYTAPEQVLGAEADFQCDVFAYGVTYYEPLTGRHPFEAADVSEVLYRLAAEHPEPLSNRLPDCPEALETIVRRTMAKDRGVRYQRIGDVRHDHAPLLDQLRRERAGSRLPRSGGETAAGLEPITRDWMLLPVTRELRVFSRNGRARQLAPVAAAAFVLALIFLVLRSRPAGNDIYPCG